MVRRVSFVFAVLFVAALALVAGRIRYHDAAAASATTDRPLALVPGERELVAAELHAGRTVVFEVCSTALLEPASLVGRTSFAIVDRTRGEEEFVLALDDTSVRSIRRGRAFGCLVVARAARLVTDARIAIVARHDASPPPNVPFAGRIVTRAPIDPLDVGIVSFPAMLALLLVAFVARLGRAPVDADATPAEATVEAEPVSSSTEGPAVPDRNSTVLVAAIGSLVLGFALAHLLPLGGALSGLARGMTFVVVQLAVVGFVGARATRQASRTALGFARATRPVVVFVAAPLVGLALRVVAAGFEKLAPSQGTAAVERLVSPSSGMVVPHTLLDSFGGVLAFASVAVVAPIVEELFFRGVVYGALERAKGAHVATIGTALLFAAVHVPQTGGALGALASIVLLSVVATLVRRRTGSVVAPVVLHFVHNASVALLVLVQNAG